jgi:hypothetical protein
LQSNPHGPLYQGGVASTGFVFIQQFLSLHLQRIFPKIAYAIHIQLRPYSQFMSKAGASLYAGCRGKLQSLYDALGKTSQKLAEFQRQPAKTLQNSDTNLQDFNGNLTATLHQSAAAEQ